MLLDKLREYPQDKTLLISTFIIFIPFMIITVFVFIINEIGLRTAYGFGVLEFELAWTPETIDTIFAAWGQPEMERQAIVTYIDYIYLVTYSLFGAGSVLIITRKLDGKLQELGLYLTLATSVAAIFDAIENANLLIMIANPADFSPINPFIASLCSVFKISFIEAGICFLYIGVIVVFIGKEKTSYLYGTLIGSGIVFTCFLFIWNYLVGIIGGAIYFIILYFVYRIINSERD